MHERKNHTDDMTELHRQQESTHDSPEEKFKTGNPSAPLLLGAPDDPSENQANQVAQKMMAGDEVNLSTPQVAAQQERSTFLPKGFHHRLNASGPGQPLSTDAQNEMESGLGVGLDDVRVHTDGDADELNRQLGANAFALGNDVYFGRGNYNPTSDSGKQLLAHELVHTRQPGDNVVRMSNDEELAQLREHDAKNAGGDENAKLKAAKQEELDRFINEQGGAQSRAAIKAEFRRQRGIVIQKEELADLDEKLKKIRHKYILKLREAGVQPGSTVDPFAKVEVPGVDRKKFLDRLTGLFELYDLHVDQYNMINEEIKADKEKLLAQNADMQQMLVQDQLSLKGVHANKTKDKRTAAERAEEVLSWAEAEARTSTYDYTLLVREKEKSDREKKKGDKKDEFDAFVTAQKIIRDDLGGDATHLTVNDIQLVLKYFLKGALSEDDKFTLVAFLSKHINDSNLEAVFGYNEKDTGTLIDPADLIKVLEGYDLLNYERRPYYEKKAEGAGLFIEMEKVRSTLVERLKDMKAAKEANDARRKNGLSPDNLFSTGRQERYKTSGFAAYTSAFQRNWAQTAPKPFFTTVMLPDSRHVAANKLQNAINEYDAASPTPAIGVLQDAAWEFYTSIHPGEPPMTQADFYAMYDTRAEIQFLLNMNVNPAEMIGGKYRSTEDSYADLGGEIFAVSLQTGVDYFKLKERVEYFRKTDPEGFWSATITLGLTGIALAMADAVMHDDASPGQVFLPLGNLGLSGSHTLVDRKTPVYNGAVSNKLSFDWSTKRDDAPPGLGMFNTLYNPGNTHPFFKGKNSVPGVFGTVGVTGSNSLSVDNKEKEKFGYNASMTIHYAPGSEGTQLSDETLLGRFGMFMQQPTNPQQAATLINNSPEKDMVNLWGKTGFTYKNDWFMMNGSVAGGAYNLSGPKNERMGAFDYKFGMGVDKLKLGDFKISGSAGISGSYADSPTQDAQVSSTLSLKTGIEWKSFKFSFSFDDDLTKPEVYNKYKAELEYNGLGRYSPWVFKATLMNMYNLGLNQMAVTGGFVLGYNFGSGGKNYRIQKID